jgi:hypothetical protein
MIKSSKTRPEYIKCIQHTHADRQKTSWCGQGLSSFDWCFQNIDHAAYSIENQNLQVPCPECLLVVKSALFDR